MCALIYALLFVAAIIVHIRAHSIGWLQSLLLLWLLLLLLLLMLLVIYAPHIERADSDFRTLPAKRATSSSPSSAQSVCRSHSQLGGSTGSVIKIVVGIGNWRWALALTLVIAVSISDIFPVQKTTHIVEALPSSSEVAHMLIYLFIYMYMMFCFHCGRLSARLVIRQPEIHL